MSVARKSKVQSHDNFGGPMRKASERVERTRRFEGGEIIKDDHQLLKALGLSIPEAAGFLGKTRQALSARLSGANAASGIFKLSDLIVLVLGARQVALVDEKIDAHPFNFAAIARYLEESRAEFKDDPTYGLLMKAIGRDDDIALDTVEVVAFVIPTVVDLTSQRPDIAQRIGELSEALARLGRLRASILLSSTELQAKIALQSLLRGLSDVIPVLDPAVERYVPMVLLFDERKTAPRVYMFVENGGLVEAPQYRTEMLGAWIKTSLMEDVRREFFPELVFAN